MDAIMELAVKHSLYVIEDACEAMGSKWKGQKVGTIGDMGCFSFFVSHTITTGEGGAIVTNDDRLADLCRKLRNHGRAGSLPGQHFEFGMIGFNAKMNVLEACIGLGQMNIIEDIIAGRRQSLIDITEGAELGENDGITMKQGENEYIVPHCYPILAQGNLERDLLLQESVDTYGVESRAIFCSIPTQCSAYSGKFGFKKDHVGGNLITDRPHFPVAEDIGNRGIFFPCHQNLTQEDKATIAKMIKEKIKE